MIGLIAMVLGLVSKSVKLRPSSRSSELELTGNNFGPIGIALLLVALPLAVYWPTIWAHFGFRDDYSISREAREEPSKIVDYCASHARPIYGWLLATSFHRFSDIDDLPWMRLATVVLLGLLAASFFGGFVFFHKWPLGWAGCLGACIALVPTAQILVSWSICWPHLVASLLAVGAFALAEFTEPIATRRVAGAVGAVLLLIVSAWIYQSNTLFYLVFIAGGLFTARREDPRRFGRWLSWHGGILMLGLGLAFVLIESAYALGIWEQSNRVAFDLDPLGKLWWYLQEPFENAVALFALDDMDSRAEPTHITCALLVAAIIAGAGFIEWRKHDQRAAFFWWTAFLFLMPAAYMISIIASERWSTYRTIHPQVGIVLVFLLLSLQAVCERFPRLTASVVCGGFAAIMACAAVMAQRQTYELIVKPQQTELSLIENGAKRLDPNRLQRVFMITPSLEDAPSPLIYADEFGALSTDSDWTPKEMLKQVLHAKYPGIHNISARCEMACGRKLNPAIAYDVVIDLRHLR